MIYLWHDKIATLLVLAIKIPVLYYYFFQVQCSNPDRVLAFLALSSGDTFSYIEPVQNLILHGEYFIERSGIQYYSVRPPYWSLLYLVFALLIGESGAYTAAVVLAIFLDALATLAISAVVYDITKRKSHFYFSLFVFSLAVHASHLSLYILPDSMSISLCSIAIFLAYKSNASRVVYMIAASFLLAISVGLRPYTLFILPAVIAGLILIQHEAFCVKKASSIVLLMTLPFIVVLGPWVARNFVIYGTFSPYEHKLVEAYYGENFSESPVFAKRKFLNSLGESDIFWDYKSAASFFESDISEFKRNSRYVFPAWLTESAVSIESLNRARNSYLQSMAVDDAQLRSQTREMFESMTLLVKERHPFRYYLLNRLATIKYMVAHSGSYFLPVKSTSPCYVNLQIYWKVFESIIYYLSVISLPIVCIFLFRKNSWLWLPLASLPLSIIFIAAILFQSGEQRYFSYAFPALAISFGLLPWVLRSIYVELRGRGALKGNRSAGS